MRKGKCWTISKFYSKIFWAYRKSKVIDGIDVTYHGIRFDAQILQSGCSNGVTAKICDVEMEDRDADRKSLPKRHRYYTALTDAKALPTSVDFTELPDYSYDDGVTHLFLYADGKVNMMLMTGIYTLTISIYT